MKAQLKTILSCLVLCGLAGTAPAQSVYKPKNFFTGNGYSEKHLGDGVWRIRANVGSASDARTSAQMALLRGAELVQASGLPFIELLETRTWMVTRTSGKKFSVDHYTTEVKIRGAREPRDQGKCEIANRTICPMYGVDFVLNNVGPAIAGGDPSGAGR